MIKLNEISTRAPEGMDKKEARKQTKEWTERIGVLQEQLYAQKKYALLIVLQGMDASGKDGALKNIFDECHPAGMKVIPFKKPTEEEFAHDFLWRIHRHAPPKGMIHIFVRSHYEDVLIQRVHSWIDEEHARRRIESINAMEELLAYDNNTLILKFYLHISKEQQEIELQQRIDEKDKHWKHNSMDWIERKYWDSYMRCYEDAINRSRIPWHIIPVDQRWYRDYTIAQTLLHELEKLDLEYPPLPKD
jgi:PPK2 family polyphosphate:nucleotide phosphotransferase